MKSILLISIVLLSLSSCVSTSNLYQDGKTLGKDSLDGFLSLTLHSIPKYIHEDTTKDMKVIGDDHLLSPWVQFQLQWGANEKLDLGATLGTGFTRGFGMSAFAKYALLPKESRIAIALYGQSGFSFSSVQADDKKPDDDRTGTLWHLNSMCAVPISFDLSKRVTLVLQPIYTVERITIKGHGIEGIAENATRAFESYRLGTGLMVTNKKGRMVHYNITTAYYPETKVIAPSFGVALNLRK